MAKLQFIMVSPSTNPMALIRTKTKVDIPEKQPVETIVLSSPSFPSFQQVHAKKFELFYFSELQMSDNFLANWSMNFNKNPANLPENQDWL